MTAVPIFEAKNKLPYFIHLAEDGETIQLTRHGKPVARIIAEERCTEKTDGQIFMEKVMEWREKNKDWLSDSDIDNAFNIKRKIEPPVRHPEDIDW